MEIQNHFLICYISLQQKSIHCFSLLYSEEVQWNFHIEHSYLAER